MTVHILQPLEHTIIPNRRCQGHRRIPTHVRPRNIQTVSSNEILSDLLVLAFNRQNEWGIPIIVRSLNLFPFLLIFSLLLDIRTAPQATKDCSDGYSSH